MIGMLVLALLVIWVVTSIKTSRRRKDREECKEAMIWSGYASQAANDREIDYLLYRGKKKEMLRGAVMPRDPGCADSLPRGLPPAEGGLLTTYFAYADACKKAGQRRPAIPLRPLKPN